MGATKDEIYQAKTLAELQSLERRYKYKFGWANRIHDARTRKKDRSAGGALGKEKQDKAKEEGAGGTARQMVLFS